MQNINACKDGHSWEFEFLALPTDRCLNCPYTLIREFSECGCVYVNVFFDGDGKEVSRSEVFGVFRRPCPHK